MDKHGIVNYKSNKTHINQASMLKQQVLDNDKWNQTTSHFTVDVPESL